jgi:SAM-dependent methyltransferase
MVKLILTNNGLPMHLGGSDDFVHTDDGALDFLIKTFDIKSWLDIGCGPGWMVKKALERGLDAYGVDGDFTVTVPEEIKDRHFIHDFSTGPWVPPLEKTRGKFDLAWTVEFVEHVEARYIQNFVTPMQQCKYVVMTHAFPNQPGHHHVNCQTTEYWIHVMRAFGFEADAEATNALRASSTMEERYIRQQSLFLRNLNYAD